MSVPLKIFPRPPIDRVGDALMKVREKAEPELVDLLEQGADGLDWQLLITLHIQDGFLNHIRVTATTTRDMDAATASPPKELSVNEMLKGGLAVLRGRLQSSLVSGYHGHVVMKYESTGEKRIFSCQGEKVYRVQSGRVPT